MVNYVRLWIIIASSNKLEDLEATTNTKLYYCPLKSRGKPFRMSCCSCILPGRFWLKKTKQKLLRYRKVTLFLRCSFFRELSPFRESFYWTLR